MSKTKRTHFTVEYELYNKEWYMHERRFKSAIPAHDLMHTLLGLEPVTRVRLVYHTSQLITLVETWTKEYK